jgi:hypothetical protein
MIFNFVLFAGTKKVGQQIFVHPFLLDPGIGMDKNQGRGSGINNLDPQNWQDYGNSPLDS